MTAGSSSLDGAFGRATATCAETLSALAEAGVALNEAHQLQPRYEEALGAELPGSVHAQKTFEFRHWKGNPEKRLGGVDVVVEVELFDRSSAPAARSLAELKWAGDRETLAWTVFDSLKMASAHSSRLAVACYVVAGAPIKQWNSPSSAGALLTDNHHDVAALITAYDGRNELFSSDVAWPTVLPSKIETVVVADAPVATAQGLWKLKCVRVVPASDDTIRLSGGRLVG